METMLRERFVSRVRELMRQRGWSQAHLAREMGATPQYVCNYLSGRYSPGLEVCERFATALGIDPKELFEDTAVVAL